MKGSISGENMGIRPFANGVAWVRLKVKCGQIHNSLFKAGALCFRCSCCCWHKMDLNVKPKTFITHVSFTTYAFLIGVGFLQMELQHCLLCCQMPAEERSHSLPDSVFVCISPFPGDLQGSSLLH